MPPVLTPPRPVNLFVGSITPALLVSTTTWSAANDANVYAFQVNRAITVTTAYFRVQTASGNMDCGIYDDAGALLGSTGSFAVPAQNQSASQALAASVTLVPGVRYWAAMACDNNTAAFGMFSGVLSTVITGYKVKLKVASSMPLPNPITFGTTSAVNVFGVYFA